MDQMTLSEFFVSLDGFAQAHSGSKSEDEIPEDEFLRVLMEEQAAGRA